MVKVTDQETNDATDQVVRSLMSSVICDVRPSFQVSTTPLVE